LCNNKNNNSRRGQLLWDEAIAAVARLRGLKELLVAAPGTAALLGGARMLVMPMLEGLDQLHMLALTGVACGPELWEALAQLPNLRNVKFLALHLGNAVRSPVESLMVYMLQLVGAAASQPGCLAQLMPRLRYLGVVSLAGLATWGPGLAGLGHLELLEVGHPLRGEQQQQTQQQPAHAWAQLPVPALSALKHVALCGVSPTAVMPLLWQLRQCPALRQLTIKAPPAPGGAAASSRNPMAAFSVLLSGPLRSSLQRLELDTHGAMWCMNEDLLVLPRCRLQLLVLDVVVALVPHEQPESRGLKEAWLAWLQANGQQAVHRPDLPGPCWLRRNVSGAIRRPPGTI
jgi:hypothetical protein